MRTTTRVLCGAALVLALAGCGRTVPLQPAEDAANPACAAIIVRLPDAVADLPKQETNAQATGAWGAPSSVLLRCGVTVPGPTATLPCVTVQGVDWLRDDADDPNFVFTTYGRDPATEVIVNAEGASGLTALTDLADAVKAIDAERACISPQDVAPQDGTE